MIPCFTFVDIPQAFVLRLLFVCLFWPFILQHTTSLDRYTSLPLPNLQNYTIMIVQVTIVYLCSFVLYYVVSCITKKQQQQKKGKLSVNRWCCCGFVIVKKCFCRILNHSFIFICFVLFCVLFYLNRYNTINILPVKDYCISHRYFSKRLFAHPVPKGY